MTEVAALGLRVDGADGIERASGALDDFTRASQSAEKSTDQLAKRSSEGKRSLDAFASSGSKATSIISQLAVAALKVGAAVGIGLSINALKNYADAWSDMQSVVGASIGDMSAAAGMMDRIVDIANASYSPLQQTVEVYSRNVAVLQELGKNSAQAADFTESLNHMLVLTATRGERAASVQNALSKAMAVGSLQADGLETILANGGEVAKALATQLGTTVNGLRKFASEGRITGQVIADAIIKPLDDVRDRAAEMPATMADSFTRIQTNITQLVGSLDKATGASSAVAGVVLAFADEIQAAGKQLIPFAQSLVPLLATAFDALSVAMTAAAAVLASRLIASFITYAVSAVPAAITATIAFASSITGLQAAIALAAAKMAIFSAASRALGAALALVGGPIGAIVLAVGAAGYAWYQYGQSARDNADAGALGVANMQGSVDQLVASYQKLNEEQQKAVLNIKTEDLASATKEAQQAVYDLGAAFEPALSQGTRAAAQFRADFTSQIQEITSNTALSTEQMAASLTSIINAHIASGQATAESRAELELLVQKFSDASGNASRLKAELDALKGSQDAVKQAAASTNLAPKGMEKWDEYLRKLTDARDMIGMNARQLGEFQAAQAGANSVQQQMSGIITAQTNEYRNLQSAIEGKDKKAAEAAQSNIRALDIERQKVELLAIKTQALMAATAAFAKNGIASDVAGGVLQNMLKGFAQAEAAIGVSAQADAQIKYIYANTTPRKTGGGGGGGSGGKSAIQTAAENDAKALKEVRREIELVQLAGEELAQAKARDKLSEYATPEQIGLMKQLTAELYRQQELAALREKIGDDPIKYIRGIGSPADVANDPYASYQNDIDAENQRYADELTRLTDVMEAKKGIWDQYYSEFERMQGEHNDRMGRIERASLEMSLGTASRGFGELASALKDSQGEQSAAYKAMFAASKAFAIAQSAIALGGALSEAWRLPWPANIAALGVAASSMATIISSIQAVSLAGQAHDGIMSIPEDGTWNLKKGERVTTANTSAKLDSTLERIDARQRSARSAANESTYQGSENQRPIVNLIEDRSRAGQVESQRNANGGNEINIFVADIRGGGNAAQALEQTYGLTRVGR